MKEYKSTLDSDAKYAVPGLVLLITILVFISHPYVGVTFSEKNIPIGYIIPALLIILFVWLFMQQPLSIKVDDYSITINRRMKPVIIEFSAISSIRTVENMKFAVRTFGNGGLFGFTGKYYKKGIGNMTWYCTQRKNYILVEKTNGKKIVFTPDDPDGFMQDMREKHAYLITSEPPAIN